MINCFKLLLLTALLMFLPLTSFSFGFDLHVDDQITSCDVSPVGDGTFASPYLIATLDNLLWLSQNQDKWNAHFLQTDDIDASQTAYWNEGEGWVPIGNSSKRFSGVFNGDGKVITGLTINRPESEGQGFFGETLGATLRNIHLANISVIGTINVGGLVGGAKLVTIENVSVSGEVKGDVLVGLLVGLGYDINVDRCQSHGVVNGKYAAGGLIGFASSSEVKSSLSSANIFGSDDLGGLVGSMQYSSIVENCYASGNTLGSVYTAGGLVGTLFEDGTIRNSYSYGQVSNSIAAGGLIGRIGEKASILNSFWDVEASSLTESAAGDGLTTAEMNDFQSFISVGWDFKGTGKSDIWNIGNDRNNGYPYFNWQYPDDEAPNEEFRPVAVINSVTEITSASATVNAELLLIGNPVGEQYGICWNTEPSPTVNDFVIYKGVVAHEGIFSVQLTELTNNTNYYIRAFAENEVGINYSKDFTILTYDITPQKPDGLGTDEEPYLIDNLANLLWLSVNPVNWDKSYSQTNSIDASSTSGWNNGEGWMPIGRVDNTFRGGYNGNGYCIDGLTINRPEGDYQGLFGQAHSAKFHNIALTNLNITGSYRVGGLAGRTLSNSVIQNSFATGKIEGRAYVGGLVGSTSGSYLDKCYSVCSVLGDFYVGGLVGISREGLTSNTYSLGNVEGDRYVGGLIGQMYEKASLHNSYSKGKVNGAEDTGGLIGYIDDASVSGCFWDMETSGYTESAGGKGITTEEMRAFQTFISVGWDFAGSGVHEIWNIGNNRNNGYPYITGLHPDITSACSPEYLQSFRVVNFLSHPVLNAAIFITGEELVTNDLGEASIWLMGGIYDYAVKAQGFLDKFGNITIAGSNNHENVELSSVVTSGKEAISVKVSVYPNPASECITIESNEIIEFISLFSIDGRQIYHNEVDQQQYLIHIDNLHPGVFFVKIKTTSQIVVKQIVIRR